MLKPARRFCAILGALMLPGVVSADTIVDIDAENRNLLIAVSDLSDGATGLEGKLYDFIEFTGPAEAQVMLMDDYGEIVVLRDAALNLPNFVETLDRLTAQRGEVTDVIFMTHGMSDELTFADGQKEASVVANEIIRALSPLQRARLRMMFSTACFGAQHVDDWLRAGFKTAAGSKGVVSDTATSFIAFLAAWGRGYMFDDAVYFADNPRHAHWRPVHQFNLGISEAIAREMFPNLVVDNTRIVRGDHAVTNRRMIYPVPLTGGGDFDPQHTTRGSDTASGRGGASDVLQCPPSQILVGLHGKNGTMIDRVGPLCAPLSEVRARRHPASVERLRTVGGDGGSRFTRDCTDGESGVPGNRVLGLMVDYQRNSGALRSEIRNVITGIRVLCTDFNARGRVLTKNRAGKDGDHRTTIQCPRGQVPAGINVRSGRLVDQISLRCKIGA